MCMTIVHSGTEYQVYTNQIETFKSLPVGAYYIEFSKNKGFFLVEAPDIKIGEKKVYGHRGRKAKKIFDAFARSERSVGVILSGAKGIGKSLFARVLCRHAIDSKEMPVIIVRNYIPGIAEFIETIEQECLVMFDEFDKTIGGRGEDAEARQTEFIQLFDGIVQSKRLYVITCNETWSLSEFFINRPGRFHYHIRFKNPDVDEITEYLKDKVDEQYWDEIDKVCDFAKIVPLNYDMLRAIAFELNSGEEFEDAIQDMNITQENGRKPMNAVAVLRDGRRSKTAHCDIDFGTVADDVEAVRLHFDDTGLRVCVKFSVWNMVFKNGEAVVNGGDAEIVEYRLPDGDGWRDGAPDGVEIDHLTLSFADSVARHDTASFRFV